MLCNACVATPLVLGTLNVLHPDLENVAISFRLKYWDRSPSYEFLDSVLRNSFEVPVKRDESDSAQVVGGQLCPRVLARKDNFKLQS